jgi:O-methyltransferase domain/Dimerisation domain
MVARMAFWPLLRVLNGTRRTRSWAELKLLLRDRLLPATATRSKDENPPPPALFQMATSYWVSQAIYVAAKLGVADLLVDGPQSCVALAAATRSEPSSLFRLLRALASVGVFSQQDNDYFALTRLAESLRSNVPGSLRDLLITVGEIHYQACGELLHSVQTGKPAFTKVFGANLFDYLQQNTDAAEAFNRGMTDLSSLLAHAVLLVYDFSGISSIIDVGGGEGELLRRILTLNPEMTGVVFDLPNAIQSMTCAQSDRARYSYVAGNFFESVPEGAAAYLLCGVVHDWDDDRAVTVLRNCRKAMTGDSRVLIVDMIVPETNSASFSKLLDLNMMVMTGGRERTKAEFHALLDAADYRLTRIIPTMAPQSIMEAMPK